MYALESPLLRAVWVLLWWADYVSSLVGLTYSWFGLLLGPAVCEGYWLLVGTTWSWEADYRTPVAPMGYCWLTAGWIRVWKIHGSFPLAGRLCQVLGLVLHFWQAAQWPEMCLQGPKLLSWSLCWPASGQGRPQIFPGHGLACWGQDESTGCMI